MSNCRVCDAGPAGQRMHKCPNSRYYIPGSDPAAEYLDSITFGDTCCGKCPFGACYVDQMSGS